jgi:hypothetical protein
MATAYPDGSYFERRAVQEVEMAVQATHPAAVAAHYRMANAYLERAGAVVVPEASPEASRTSLTGNCRRH